MRRAGFTLIETLLAIALAGVLAGGAAYSIRRLVPKYDLQRAVWEITTSLNEARFRAVWEGVAVRFRAQPPGYRLERYDDAAKTWDLLKPGALEGVAVEANNTPAFYPQGTVSDLASILVSNAWGSYKITVAITGRIKSTRLR